MDDPGLSPIRLLPRVHDDPPRAKSDAQNAVALAALEPLLRRLSRLADVVRTP